MQGCYPSSKMDLVKAITGGRLGAVTKKTKLPIKSL